MMIHGEKEVQFHFRLQPLYPRYSLRTEIRREGQSLSASDPQFPSGPVHRHIVTSELSLLSSPSKSSVRNDTVSRPRHPESALANEAIHQLEHPILSGQ